MSFANPEYFHFIWFVLPLAFIYFYGIRKRARIVSSFFHKDNLKTVFPGYSPLRRTIKAILGICVFILFLLAATGPQYGHIWQEYEAKGIEIILAVDCSRSMLAPDIQPTRLDRAKREIIDLINMLEGDKIGLVAFSGTAFLQCPLTLDYTGYSIFLNALSPDYLPVGGTDFEAAITTAMDSFDKNSNAEKAVILITDGEATSGDAMKAAKAASEKGIRIFCIGVGGDTAAPVPEKDGGFKKDTSGNMVLSRLDEDILKKMASETKGAYVRSVAGDMDLDQIYRRDIRGGLDQSVLKAGKRKILENRFQWPLFVAVLLFLLDFFLPASRRLNLILLLILFPLFTCKEARAETVHSLMKSAEKSYHEGNFEKALEDLTKAQIKEPVDPDIFYNIGNTFYKMGQFDAASKSYNGALENAKDKNKASILYNLGNSEFKKAEYESAVKAYEEALKLSPEDKKARDNLELAKKMAEQKKDRGKNKEDSKDNNKENEQENKNKADGSDNDKQNDQDTGKNDENKSGEKNDSSPKPDNGNEKDKSRNGGDSEQKKEDQNSSLNDISGNDSYNNNHKDSASSDSDDKQGQNQVDGNNASSAPQNGNEEKKKNDSGIRLNRLQDKPGAAMIPAYNKRNIEKDW